MRGGGMKVLALLLAFIVGVVTLIVVLITALGEEEEAGGKCTPGGAGGAGGAGVVSSEGTAFPTDPEATEFTSGFGPRDGAEHNGVDYAGPIGTDIYAFADGDVVAAGEASGFGNWVVLDHTIDGEDHTTVYGHMAADQIDVSVGDTVEAGDKIAGIGNEGQSTGPHLHFEFYDGHKLTGGGTPVDPQQMLEDVQADGGSGDRSSGDDTDDEESSDAGPANGSPAGGGGNTSPNEDVALGVPNDVGALDERQLNNVRAIISTGKALDADEKVIKAALMAAGPESGYRMLASRAVPESLEHPNDGVTPGDATSVGLFQIQTPMNMPTDEAMDREKHITWFYDTADGVDTAQEAWEIAADVERPREDLRGKYKEWEGVADILLETEGDIDPADLDCAPGGDDTDSSGETPENVSEFADKAIAAAREQLGVDYVWGGGDWNGETGGGFDCSGLTMYAYSQASGGSIQLDHHTTAQMNSELLEDRDTDDIQPGDLVFFNGADDPQHMGLAISSTEMIHAPETGDVVKEAPISDGGDLVAARTVKEIPNDDQDD